MSDQAVEQSLSIEDRFQNLLEPEPQEQQEELQQEAEPQDNSEEPVDTEEEATPEEEQGEPEEEASEPDLVEIELDGKTYQIPEELKDKVMLQADYTRKTQEVAEQRKQLEIGYQQLQQQAQLQQQNLEGYANLMAIDKQLQAAQNTDWNALFDSDPAEFVRQKEAYRELKDYRDGLANQIGAIQQQQLQEQQAVLAKTQETARQILSQDLKWDGAKADATRQYIESFIDKGLSQSDIDGLNQGRYGATPIIWAHKAMLYDKLQASKGNVEKRVSNLPKVSKPGAPNKSVAQQQDTDLRKNLKKSGSLDDAAKVFFNRMNRQR